MGRQHVIREEAYECASIIFVRDLREPVESPEQSEHFLNSQNHLWSVIQYIIMEEIYIRNSSQCTRANRQLKDWQKAFRQYR